MRFIDLFAGLGGFHQGLSVIKDMECVFACEINPELRQLYKDNFGIIANGDITKINAEDIPKHDVLCAGFPCQPFSLAGKKEGQNCDRDGRLVDHIIRIAKHHKPALLMLENVPGLLKAEGGAFWEEISTAFENLGYHIKTQIYSPIDFDIPQNRKRLFIIGFLNETAASQFEWPQGNPTIKTSLDRILDHKDRHRLLEVKKRQQLRQWQILLDHVGNSHLSSDAIMAPEFGATYPYDFSSLRLDAMRQYQGAYGASLRDCKNWHDVLCLMPSYTRKQKKIAKWQTRYIKSSRALYKQDPNFFDSWLIGLDKQNNSWQILEWRGEKDKTNLADHLIQFRASGIRIMKRHIAPSLTAMTPTQIPIIGKDMRYLTKKEASHLQFLHRLAKLPTNNSKAFRALGNAVNAKIVETIARSAVMAGN